MTSMSGAEEIAKERAEALREELAEYTLEGTWDKVVEVYKEHREAHTVTINHSRDTALHVAVDLDEEKYVEDLVSAIIAREEQEEREEEEDIDAMVMHPEKAKKLKPLEMGNERGDTPLHVAASRGFAKPCECIIGRNKERLHLSRLRNKQGETPLFLAALNWNKQAFAYLLDATGERITLPDLVRNNGDSILHCAIGREYFDLAVIIVHHFGFLSTLPNEDGVTPLNVLATRPSAFRSGIKLSWWKLILYHCTLVEPLDAKSTMKKILRKMNQTEPVEKLPKNYATLCDFLKSLRFVAGKLLHWGNDKRDPENPKSLEKHEARFFPPNYDTIRQFIKAAYVHILGLSGVALKEVEKTKKKHQWSGQLLEALMQNPYEAFTGKGGDRPNPRDWVLEPDVYELLHPLKQEQVSSKTPGVDSGKGTPSRQDAIDEKETPFLAAVKNGIVELVDKIQSKIPKKDAIDKEETPFLLAVAMNGIVELVDKIQSKIPKKDAIDKKETPFLAAAKYGIVELVDKIQSKIPSAIYDTNSKKQNVLLVAVINRQPRVIETLRMRMRSKSKLWDNLILASDDEENTMLHLAAQALGKDKPWGIAGSALQMMWEIKWFQYIKSIVPQHFYSRSNNKTKTAEEIFAETHKELVKDSSEWLKDTSESCSLVAALVAGVSFATASAVPGGTNDEGEAPLEGRPAFDAFAIASLIGLCFSVTGLIMFLSILTSRKEANDFRRGLPLKLLLGLSSLFVSIIAMFLAFCSGNFFLINQKYKTLLLPLYAATSLPVAFYAVAQFPLYLDLFIAIINKVPRPNKGNNI